MGKNNLILGTARGKLGDVVFYRTDGEQRFRTRVRPTNPRTSAQLLQRCVVSTAVKYYASVITVCDHAFQNYVGKLKNHQRFMRLNIAELRKIALGQIYSFSPLRFNNIKIGNWAKKNDTEIPLNAMIIAEGDLPSIQIGMYNEIQGSVDTPAIYGTEIWNNASNLTYADFAENIGAQIGDQITFIIQTRKKGTGYLDKTYISRIILMPKNGNPNETKIFSGSATPGNKVGINSPNDENYGSILFTTVENSNSLYVTTNDLEPTYDSFGAFGVIVSRYENGAWRRSNSTTVVAPDAQDLLTLEQAMTSYEKSDTSSLYLNQAQNKQKDNATMALEEAIRIEEEIIEEEEKAKKNSKKAKE